MTPAAAHTTARRLVALLKAVTDAGTDFRDHDALSRAYELLGLAFDLAAPLADYLDAEEGRALQEVGLVPPPVPTVDDQLNNPNWVGSRHHY